MSVIAPDCGLHAFKTESVVDHAPHNVETVPGEAQAGAKGECGNDGAIQPGLVDVVFAEMLKLIHVVIN